MRKIEKSVSSFTLFFCAMLLAYSPLAQTEDEVQTRNVRIDVEFKEVAETQKGILSGTIRDSRTTGYTKQFIVVSEGLPASIFIGENMPYITYYREYLLNGGYIEREVVFREVGTKLKVIPRIIGDSVEITLTPQISYVSDKKRGTIDLKTLTTTVIVKDGQSLSIGGLQKDAEFERYFLKSSSESNLDIILTPHIQ